MRLVSLPLLFLGSIGLLTGCALTSDAPLSTNVATEGFRGVVYGGQNPITGATVSMYAAGTSGYGAGSTLIANAIAPTNAGGGFAFAPVTCPFANTPTYLLAKGGDSGSGVNANIVLAAGLGPCSGVATKTINLNEVTTIATAYALGQFFTTTLGPASTDSVGGTAAGAGVYNVGLVAADTYTIPALVNIAAGAANFTNTSGNLTTTVESAKLYSLANSLAACVNTKGETSQTETTTACGKLFSYTTPPGGTRPYDTLQAAVQMALFPYQNVTPLYVLSSSTPPFIGLSATPNDLTLGISYTSTALGLGVSGGPTVRTSSNLDIDATGKVWFPTNTAGAHGVAYFDPTSRTFNGPYSTGLVQPQYVAIDMLNQVYATDLSSGTIYKNSTTAPTTAGTTTPFAASVSGGPLTIDLDNAVLFSYKTNAGALMSFFGVLTGGTPSQAATFTYNPTGIVNERAFSGPTGAGDDPRHVYAISSQGGGGVCALEEVFTTSGGSPTDNAAGSGIASCFTGGGAISTAGFDELFSVSSTNQLFEAFSTQLFTPTVPLSGPQGIATDGAGNEWIANAGNASVSTLGYTTAGSGTSADYLTTSPIAYLHGSSNGGTMTTPYGIGVDRSGNVWVSNASCVTTTTTACAPTAFTLSELIGAGAPTITPVSAQGVQTGTLPTAAGISPVRTQARRRPVAVE